MFFPKIVFRISGEILLQSPALEESGRLYLPAVRHPWEPLGSIGPPAPPQHTTGSTLSLQGSSPAASSWSVVRAPNSGAGGNRAPQVAVWQAWAWLRGAPGRAGKWDAGPAGAPALAQGGEERAARGGHRGDRGRGRVLGAWRAANVPIALGPPRLSAQDELHLEKGLLQAGRQQDRLGAAQDLRVPDARRQRGLRRRVVRPPGLCAGVGARGGGRCVPGASGWNYGGRPGTGTPAQAGGASGRAGAQPMPPSRTRLRCRLSCWRSRLCAHHLDGGPQGPEPCGLGITSRVPFRGRGLELGGSGKLGSEVEQQQEPQALEAGLGPLQAPSLFYYRLGGSFCGLN